MIKSIFLTSAIFPSLNLNFFIQESQKWCEYILSFIPLKIVIAAVEEKEPPLGCDGFIIVEYFLYGYHLAVE